MFGLALVEWSVLVVGSLALGLGVIGAIRFAVRFAVRVVGPACVLAHGTALLSFLALAAGVAIALQLRPK